MCKSKTLESAKTNDEPQLNQSNKIGDKVTLNKEKFESGNRTQRLDHGRSMGKENNNRKIVDSEPLRDRDVELEHSEENPQNKYWLRSQPGKSCGRMIQDLISQDSDSDSTSEEEMSKRWKALHSVDTSHHLHKQSMQRITY